MRIKKNLLPVFLLLVACLPLSAQVKFSTVISEKEIGKNGYLQVEYVIENAKTVEQLTAPDFPGFTIVSGPMQQNSMSIINGVSSRSEGISFVLKPKAVGKATIAGATATIDGKPMHSNTVAVSVTNSSSASPAPSNPLGLPFGLSLQEEEPEVNEEYLLKKGENATDKIKSNLLVKLDVSKTSCYVGEPIVATYKLCSRLKSESTVTKRPSLSQFSVYDMVQPEANNPSIEKINGKLFNVHTIRKVQLYPLQDGSFELDPVELDNTVRFVRTEAGNSKNATQQMLDDYMNGLTQGKLEELRITLASKPAAITVKPLPAEGRPASFDGAVGKKFSISASLAQLAIEANETVLLNVELKGQGNIPLINAPQVLWPQGAEGEEPKVKEDIDKTVAPISGSKLFQYPFTVKEPGRVIIPAIEFSYFDAAANAYKTIKTNPVIADVVKETKHRKKKAAVTEQPSNAGNNDYKRKLLWLIPVLIVTIAGFFFLRKNKKLVKQQPVAAGIEPVTGKINVYTDPFEAAKKNLTEGNSPIFYKELGNAVWKILAEKLYITSSQLNKPVVVSLLQQKGVSTITTLLLESVLHDCEMALYTPVHSETGMRLTLDKAERLAKELELL